MNEELNETVINDEEVTEMPPSVIDTMSKVNEFDKMSQSGDAVGNMNKVVGAMFTQGGMNKLANTDGFQDIEKDVY